MKKYYELHGRRATISEWAKLVGISRQAMSQRVAKVESPEQLEKALTDEDNQGKSPKPNGNRKKGSKKYKTSLKIDKNVEIMQENGAKSV